MADLDQIHQLSGALRELSELIPTRPMQDYEQSLTAVAMATGKNVQQFGELKNSIEEFTEGTNMSRNDLARFTAGFVDHTNKLALSTRQFQQIAQITSKTDPFNTELRLRQIQDLTRRYGAFTADFSDNTKRQAAALKAMNLAVHEGNEGLASFFLQMSRGATYQDSFTAKMAKTGSIFQDTRLQMANFIGESKLLDGALGLLQNRWVSQGVALYGVYKGMQGIRTVSRAVSTLAGGGAIAGTAAPAGGAAVAAGAGRGMFRRFGGTIPGAVLGAYDLYNAQPEERPRIAAQTAGGMIGGAVGGFFGNVPGAIIGALIGEKVGGIIVDYFAGKRGSKPAVLTFDQQLEGRANAIADQRRTIQTSQASFALAAETYDPEQQRARSLTAQQGLTGQMQGLGIIGPGAGLSIAQQQITQTQGLIKAITADHEAYLADVTHSQTEINANTIEFNTIVSQLRGQQLNQVQTARRSILEQFTAAAVNAPNGTYTMPRGLSDRQKYGGSYYENMPLVDISNRQKQPRYQDMTATFQPIINQVMSSMRGHAGGGLIPGAPSSRDNTVSAVASGEYVVNAGAVQHYGVGVFDALNRKSAPRFAGGGWWGTFTGALQDKVDQVVGFDRMEKARSWIVDKIDPHRDEMNRREGGIQAHNMGEEMMRIQGMGGEKFKDMPPDKLAKYAYGVLKQEVAADMRNAVGAAAGVIAGIPQKQLEKMAANVIANHAKGSASETRLLNLALHPALREVEFIRNPRFQHHWQPGFGTSPLHMGRLGGRTHNLTHRYFEDDVFHGGGHVSGARHIGQGSKAQSGDVQLVIKEIRTAANTIVQGFQGFARNLATT